MNFISLLKPNVLNFGFAVILSINAASVWGGVFPYFPLEAQTSVSTVSFYLAQLAAMTGAYVAGLAIGWRNPHAIGRLGVLAPSIPLSAGSLILVSAMYIPSHTMALIVAAALCVGAGSALYMTAWQRAFAARKSEECSLALIGGAFYSAVVYFGICLIPAALTAYLIPLVMVPLAGLCLWIALDTADTDQPMFEDVPAEHAALYRNVLRESAPPALCAGALGFSMGAMRFVAITHQELFNIVNLISMAALAAGAIAFLLLWRKRALSFDLVGIYRMLFPLVGVGLLLLPFTGGVFSTIGIAITYASAMLVNMLIMMHCCHIARTSGINPVVTFSFYESIVYALQIVGYAVGYGSGIDHGFDVSQLSFVSVSALFVLLIASIACGGGKRLHANRLEFLMLSPKKAGENLAKELEASQTLARRRTDGKDGVDEGGEMKDQISKRCQKVKERFALSAREVEIMELVARGRTAASIAESLFISENTVRTHLKRIYAKLDVHRKREMLAIIENIEVN
ncbi:MAG: helix-turn-helix transcriptional regulator [Slackia sp.]|nr:helix-turn-helix transcriptional regulator [Slackia sp.]